MKKASPKSIMNNFYLLKIIFRIDPMRVIGEFILSMVNVATWAFYSVVFMKYLFGGIEINRSFEDICIFIGISMAAIMVLLIFVSWFERRYILISDQRIYRHLNMMMFDKATSVDIACYETPEFYDSYTKASTEVFSRAVSVLRNMSILIATTFSSAFVIYTIFTISVFAGCISFLPVIGNFFFGKIQNKIAYDSDMEKVPFVRRQEYVNRTVYLQKFSKEIRLTSIFNVMCKTFNTAFDGIYKVIDKYWLKRAVVGNTKNILCFPLVFEGMWLFAAYSAMVSKTILIGDFIILQSAIVSTTWMLIRLTDSVVASYQNGLYINNLKTFLNYKEKISETQTGVPIPPQVRVLELKNVSFKYEGSDSYVLEDINICIKAGEKISLVGHNGAGKTTLVKLIMRLYDPTSGDILLNGINIKEYGVQAYRELIGTTFQDFQILSMTVAENVMMSRIENDDQRKRAEDALKESGVFEKISTFPNGIDTILTKEFDDDGEVLSGGQAQKIAVARAFAKDCPLVILDEPSSALDPIAEYEMYETIMKLCDNAKGAQKKLSIIISHRLSSATLADHIYMMESGKVLEEGTHKQLMEQGGNYADMFIKQAQNYLQEVISDEN